MDAFLLGTQEEVPTLPAFNCGIDASKRLAVWCERQEEKGGQIDILDEEAKYRKSEMILLFLDGSLWNETMILFKFGRN